MEFYFEKEFPLLPYGRQPKYKKIMYKIPNYPNVIFALEQENNEVYYGITQLYGGIVNKKVFSNWSDGVTDGWPYGTKYFPANLKYWDNWDTLVDMVKGDKIVNIIDKELNKVLDNHLIETLDEDIRNRK